MRKIRTFGIALAATGLLFAGAGVASADDDTPVDTGSAKLLTTLLTGSAGGGTDTEEVADGDDTPVDTGSAKLLTTLLTGSAGGGTDTEEVADEADTGSASQELLAALTKLLTGSAGTSTETE
ncbi:hypothetical protein [Nocardia sp. NPDC048505]|uniref:hypothetical protein n=1 Tax=unclassified Nocardia TaxID=2637762 RepID=UPI0033F78F88